MSSETVANNKGPSGDCRSTLYGARSFSVARSWPRQSGAALTDLLRVKLMDLAQLIERFHAIYGRPPRSKYELESWFENYTWSPEDRALIERSAMDERNRQRWRTGVIAQIQKFRREFPRPEGSLLDIERWMRSLERKATPDASRNSDARIALYGDPS